MSFVNLLGDGFTHAQTRKHTHTHKSSQNVPSKNYKSLTNSSMKQNMMSMYLNICGVCRRLGCFNKLHTVVSLKRYLINKIAAAVPLQYL